jgi:hypothetical protein
VKIFILLLALFSATAFSQQNCDIELSWIQPMKRVNGDTLTIDDLQDYELIVTMPTGETEGIVISKTLNKYKYATTKGSGVYNFQLYAIDANGVYSDPGELNFALISPSQPSLTINVVCNPG